MLFRAHKEFLVLKVHKVPKENVAHKAPKAQRGNQGVLVRLALVEWLAPWGHVARKVSVEMPAPKETRERWAPKVFGEIQDLWVRKATEDQLDQRVTPAWLDPLVQKVIKVIWEYEDL